MLIKYFQDTDTLYFILKEGKSDETRELDENTILELDKGGNLIALTIEHASKMADISSFSYQQIPAFSDLEAT